MWRECNVPTMLSWFPRNQPPNGMAMHTSCAKWGSSIAGCSSITISTMNQVGYDITLTLHGNQDHYKDYQLARETGKREPWKSWMPRKDATNIRLNVMPKWHRAVWIYSHAVQTELYNSSALLLQSSRFVQDILTPQSPCRLYVYEYQRSTSFSTTNKPKRSRNEQKSLEGKKESQFREIMQWSQGPWLTTKKIQKENLGNIARYMRERLVLGKLIVSAARIQEDSGPCFLCCTIALLQSFEFSSTFSPVARGAQPMLR